MASPVYATDMTMLHEANSILSFIALGGGASGLAVETDYYIQGSAGTGLNCVSKAAWTPALKGMLFYNAGGGITIPTDGAIISWIAHLTPNSLANTANGGIRIVVGNSNTVYNHWYMGGSDTLLFGGEWVPYALNTTVAVDANTGSPNSSLITVGALANLPVSAPGKGSPFGIDVTYYGRGELRCTNGDAGGYATIDGAALYDGDTSRKWGLMLLRDGSYFMQGLFVMGTASTTVDFRDSNRAIFIRNTRKVTANFNGFEIRNASSNISWTNISVTALGTVSRGRWVTTDNANTALTTCTFTDMGTFGFGANTICTTCTFRRTDKITLNDATLTGCTIDNNRATTAVLAANTTGASKVSGCTFVSDGTGHGLEITGSAGNFTLTNDTWTNYAGSDGSTGNEAVYINIAEGSLNLTISGGTTPSVRTAGCVVTKISGAVNATVQCKTVAGANVANAVVLVVADVGGPFPSGNTVTIVNTGTNANVHHTAHGMATNDKVMIKGASHWENNGVFTITKIDNDYYSYTLPSAPGSNPTGTITATFTVLFGNTDATGSITMSRVFSSGQPVSGRARKSSQQPYYQTSTISGLVNNATGFSATVIMIED